MSDVLVRLSGAQQQVDRSFRPDVQANPDMKIIAHESVLVLNSSTFEVFERICPGMVVSAVKANCKEIPMRDQCEPMFHSALFYVLEIVSTSAESENGEALVLPIKKASELLKWDQQKRIGLHGTDLVIGDQPFYIPIGSLLGSAPAVCGQRTFGRPLLHACLIGANSRMRFKDRHAQISDICMLDDDASRALLQCYADVRHFWSPEYLAQNKQTA